MTDDGQDNRREQSPGTMIVVVGPSGAGKDTLMDFAATQLSGRPGFHFTRRVITRSGDAGGENHNAVSMHEFNRLKDAGAFAVSWEAHGLKYGIPVAVYHHLDAGDVVIANGSRSALPHFGTAFSRLKVVNIVAQPDVLARRLEQRGRESRQDILRRLERSSLTVVGDFDVTTVDNSGAIEDAGTTIMQLLEQSLGSSRT
ncbi:MULTISPECIES: phosphonate metabolism protein/1,5-bisphosphokinase (PRPP-forming) PhnN [unclassified Agrobacterium]|uniref:phosphonate metabolism protein/1,5-bisphosphokinase (PRPP-forming) PhnN n=1 Tax=unclassified Agrobacterium TaxID=2632611 RepID=UPI000379484F|nr:MULTISPECIES: phosphonate metabolism protein/1,5-bisphosphokinase (PRPP-forming) PhnN [unclassified Agrobacterium]SNB66450.1 ribose 1,5-bisphosphokinase [Agrobacterium sp. 719_389]